LREKIWSRKFPYPPRKNGLTSFPVRVQVDASRPLGELQPFWRFFGADEPNYATMRNGRKLLRELGQLRSGQVYFRAHNLLTSGDGTPAGVDPDIADIRPGPQPPADWQVEGDE